MAADSGGNYSVSEYFGGKNTDAYKRYKEGKASGKWKDLPDFISKGGNAAGTIDSIFSAVEDEINAQLKFVQNLENNPFTFDEELARESATAEFGPYYDELLSDFVQGVELKRESVEDDQQLSKELNQFNVNELTQDFTKAIARAEEGYAGKGLFFSGFKDRAVGETTVGYQNAMDKNQLLFDREQRGYGRSLEALGLEESQRTRDVEREKKAAIESGVLQRENEAQVQYYTPLYQTYQKRFGSSASSPLSGFTVPEFLRF